MPNISHAQAGVNFERTLGEVLQPLGMPLRPLPICTDLHLNTLEGQELIPWGLEQFCWLV